MRVIDGDGAVAVITGYEGNSSKGSSGTAVFVDCITDSTTIMSNDQCFQGRPRRENPSPAGMYVTAQWCLVLTAVRSHR